MPEGVRQLTILSNILRQLRIIVAWLAEAWNRWRFFSHILHKSTKSSGKICFWYSRGFICSMAVVIGPIISIWTRSNGFSWRYLVTLYGNLCCFFDGWPKRRCQISFSRILLSWFCHWLLWIISQRIEQLEQDFCGFFIVRLGCFNCQFCLLHAIEKEDASHFFRWIVVDFYQFRNEIFHHSGSQRIINFLFSHDIITVLTASMLDEMKEE